MPLVEIRERRERVPDVNGKPTDQPLLPDERAIWYDGRLVGYVGSPPGHALMFINHEAGSSDEIVAEAQAAIAKEFGLLPAKVTNVPAPAEPEEQDANYEDEETE